MSAVEFSRPRLCAKIAQVENEYALLAAKVADVKESAMRANHVLTDHEYTLEASLHQLRFELEYLNYMWSIGRHDFETLSLKYHFDF